MDTETLGSRMRQLREGAGLSLQKVADATGFAKNTIHKWEQNVMAPNGKNLALIAEFLNVEPAYLAFGVVKHRPTHQKLTEAVGLLNESEAELALAVIQKFLTPRATINKNE
jgi:transcriptional regulator with XRE-family HTH domain